jgi:hypothetical protein
VRREHRDALRHQPKQIEFVSDCWETGPAPRILGVNHLEIFAAAGPTQAPLLVGRTPNNDNIVDLQGATGAVAIAGLNLGIGGVITLSCGPVDPATPVACDLCQTNADGSCMQEPAPEVQVDWASSLSLTFGGFVRGEVTSPGPAMKSVPSESLSKPGIDRFAR